MKIKHLNIEQTASWASKNPNAFVARVKYSDEMGEIEIVLDPEASVKLMECCAVLVRDYSRKAAEKIADAIHNSIIESRQPQLEAEIVNS